MNKILSILIVATFICVSLLSCGPAAKKGFLPNQAEVAYNYTHGGYVGQAIVTTDSEGKIDVEIDEAFLPHTLCGVSLESDDWNSGNTVFFVSRGEKSYVAKYIEYAGKKYVGVQVGNGYVYTETDENGVPIGSSQLEKDIIRDHTTMASYYDNLKSGKLKIFTQFGGTAQAITTSHYGGVTKRTSPDYWNFGQTWAGNIKAIEDFIENNGYQYSLNEIVQATEDNSDGLKLWSVADTVTGATNSDFKQYFALAQSAIARLKTY